MEWRNVYRGFLIGTSDLIPGVSGGTVAVMLGMYDQLLDAMSGLFSPDWRRHLDFLLPLGLGMASALLSLSRVIAWLLEHRYVPTQFFFLGLIVGILPDLLRRVAAQRRFRSPHIATLATAAGLVALLAFLDPTVGGSATITLTPLAAAGLFAAGAAASAAMLLPGISGSFVLLILGVYPTAIHALSTFNAGLITVIGAGVIVGLVVSSKVIRRLLLHYHDITFAGIIGLIVGSLAVIWPGLPEAGFAEYVWCGLTFTAGFAATRLFGQKGAG